MSILETGEYALPDGRAVVITRDLKDCVEGTRLFRPGEMQAIRAEALSKPSMPTRSVIEVENETTLSGIARLLHEGCAPVLALNFASAMNPGGGFLNGSQAQEESLARSSGLHASLMQAWDFYEQHRSGSSALYSDALILSPNCPVFRDDAGSLLSNVHHATFISGAAPNAGALMKTSPDDLPQIPETLRRRAECVLALAASRGYEYIVLGAWGCGVFRNDPQLVANTFMTLLRNADWSSRFRRVVFSILDPSPSADLIRIFEAAVAAY
jgi:uncharacterized protein (TIGR02452 family)